MNTYQSESQKSVSEKVILAHIEPVQKLILWEHETGFIYSKKVEYFVINMLANGEQMTKSNSLALDQGEWFFDYNSKTVYVRMSDNSDPQESFMTATYRLFFSNGPFVLSYDLTDGGQQVYYESLIDDTSAFSQEIDSSEQLGISLESEGQISLINTHGFFDPIFDRLFWENKRVTIYSWFANLPFSEARMIFDGDIENKTFTDTKVTFKIKDFVYKLRQPIKLELFTDNDGAISKDAKNRFKRILYGQTNGVLMQSVDQVLGGFSIGGTVSGSIGSQVITGIGTEFLKWLTPDDNIIIETQFETLDFKINQVISDTEIEISEELETQIVSKPFTIKPKSPMRYKNRKFFIAGHKLREPIANITEVVQFNRLRVDSVDDFFVNDIVEINGESVRIKRISGDVIILFQNLDNLPLIGDQITKSPMRDVYFNGSSFLIDRDFTISNLANECTLTLSDLAEFNVTRPKKIKGTSLTFTNGSRTITGVGTVFTEEFSSRDWIRSDDINHTDWYEILDIVDETTIILRTPYQGANLTTTNALKKNVTYIDDQSKVICDCIGKENAQGKWIKTASDCVLDLLEMAGMENIDQDRFAESKVIADYVMSLKLPIDPTDTTAPTIREVISLINKSVFGSLVSRSDFKISFDVLTPDRPEDLLELKDDDLIGQSSFTVQTRSEIYRKIQANYAHFDADRFTGEAGSVVTEYQNSFVDNLIGSKNEKIVDVYLYNEDDATTIAERFALIYSLTQSVVRVTAKMNLTLKNINDKIWLSLDRLYSRLGSSFDRKKIGIISKIQRDSESTVVEFSDLSNQFNRVATITPDDANDFAIASENEKIKNGYIVDDITELAGTDESDWGTNLIG